MKGGTTFHFVTDGIERALERPKKSAGSQVINEYMAAGLLDELELHVVPVLLGSGSRLFENLAGTKVELEQVRAVGAPGVAHIKYRLRYS